MRYISYLQVGTVSNILDPSKRPRESQAMIGSDLDLFCTGGAALFNCELRKHTKKMVMESPIMKHGARGGTYNQPWSGACRWGTDTDSAGLLVSTVLGGSNH